MNNLGVRRKASKYDPLVLNHLLTANALDMCWQESRAQERPVEQIIMSRHRISPEQMGQSLASFYDLPYEPFKPGRTPSPVLHANMTRDFVKGQGWVALSENQGDLLVMCKDPATVRGSRVVPQVYSHMSTFQYRVTTELEFEQTLDQFFGAEVVGGSVDQLLADLDVLNTEDDTDDTQALESAVSDNELVKFVNKVITDAYYQKASDIHIEPMPGKRKIGIRLRIDGSLQPYIEVPAHFRQAMVTRLKIMCDLDISERRKPQDGKIQFKKYGPLDIELRVATLPTAGGLEDVVMRILAGGEPIAMDDLGLSPHNKQWLIKAIEKPYGLFYVCGPTGSGKTTTLHSILKHLNTPDTKIWTVEDPVEITQAGLRQVQINRKAGIDFAMIMRSFLRADPDIIMVGESRDRETVAMGVEASLTGHLVFSTLHTNSAPESITRLLDMGMDPFNFSDALLGILAQRLTKKLCHCKETYEPDAAELRRFALEYTQECLHNEATQADPEGEMQKLLAHWQHTYGQNGRLSFYRPVGCERCKNTGYKGRVGLHELLIASDEIKKLVQERARVAHIFAAAVAGGMRTLKMDGMEKTLLGLTDLKMVRAVCIK